MAITRENSFYTEISSINQLRLELLEHPAVLIDFSVSYTHNRHKIHDVLEKMAARYRRTIKFINIDVGMHEDIAEAFKIYVMPTFHLYKAGEKIRVLHSSKEETIHELWSELKVLNDDTFWYKGVVKEKGQSKGQGGKESKNWKSDKSGLLKKDDDAGIIEKR